MKKRDKYIFTKGELRRKDNTLFYENEEKKIPIPVETLNSLYIMDEVKLNTKIIDYLSKKQVDIHLFGHNQNYVGSFYSKTTNNNFYLRTKQYELYKEKREIIAKEMVLGIKKSMEHSLESYYKKGDNETKEFYKKTKEIEKKIGKAKTVNQIMMLEGYLWNGYYQVLESNIKTKFEFDKRTKRKPQNEINAMISFGNSILYSKVSSQLRRTNIDLGISFLHEITDRRESLVLDIADIFKPIIVINSILKLVNRKEIKEEHFRKDLEGCLLTKEGAKIMIDEINERLNKTIEHKNLKRKVSLSTCIKLEAYKIIKSAIKEKEYKSFSIKEGV